MISVTRNPVDEILNDNRGDRAFNFNTSMNCIRSPIYDISLPSQENIVDI